MADTELLICASSALLDKGDGFPFRLQLTHEEVPAFVIRFDGQVYGYINRCQHVPVELDWQPGKLLDHEKRYLICSMHGALYQPQTGLCLAGPCRGRSLSALTIIERNGQIYCLLPS